MDPTSKFMLEQTAILRVFYKDDVDIGGLGRWLRGQEHMVLLKTTWI